MRFFDNILKLFGYFPKSELQKLDRKCSRNLIITTLFELIEQGKAEAEIFTNSIEKRFEVNYTIDYFHSPELKVKEPYTHLIKVFPFGDDMEYARLCAEELCEMLNQKN